MTIPRSRALGGLSGMGGAHTTAEGEEPHGSDSGWFWGWTTAGFGLALGVLAAPTAATAAPSVSVPGMPARRLTAVDLDAHVQHLCDVHGVERRRGGRGLAYRRGPAGRRRPGIRIPPIRSQVTYAVALHELGHLLGPGRSGTRLEKEAAAWRWALANSLVPLSDHARRSAGRRLRSYVTWAELRQHRMRPPRIPPASSSFWTLLAELEMAGTALPEPPAAPR
jgi:hypothetical protein